MTFKYNPLTGELNIFGVKEQSQTPPPPPSPEQPKENTGKGFWYYLNSSSQVNITNNYTFYSLPTLTKSWNNTDVELTAENEFVVPTAGLWTWTVKLTVPASQANNFILLGVVEINDNPNKFILPTQNTSTGFLLLNKGDKIKAGFEAEVGSSTGEVSLDAGILTTCFSMMLITPSVSESEPNDPNKDNAGNNPNHNSNTDSGNNTNQNNTPITNPLTNFIIYPTNSSYTFENNSTGKTIYNITGWSNYNGQNPLADGVIIAAKDATWNFSWNLPNYNHKDGFSLNIQVLVDGNEVNGMSSNSVSVPVKQGQKISFQLVGSFPTTAPISDQVNITFNSHNTSLTAQQQGN